MLDQALAAGARHARRRGRRRRPARRDGPRDDSPTTSPAPCERSETTSGTRPRRAQTYEQILQMLQREVARRAVRGDRSRRCRATTRAGDAGGQGHARRPQPAARQARPGRGHRGPVPTSSWTSTATCSPSSPQNVDELIDALARRQAAAERLMASLTPEQRERARPSSCSRRSATPTSPRRWRSSPTTSARCGPTSTVGAASHGCDGERAAGLRRRRRRRGELADLEQLERAARPGLLRRDASTTSTSRPLEQYLGADAARRHGGAPPARARARAAGLRLAR